MDNFQDDVKYENRIVPEDRYKLISLLIDSRNQEAHALAHRLNKLVGIASEFYEHVEKKEISKIELDLKISEAESVLNYYDSIVGKPKKYSDKKRD
jgi:hypothetical protein